MQEEDNKLRSWQSIQRKTMCLFMRAINYRDRLAPQQRMHIALFGHLTIQLGS